MNIICFKIGLNFNFCLLLFYYFILKVDWDNALIMRGSKYIPNTTFHTQSEQETPVRRRNHSMDNKVQET